MAMPPPADGAPRRLPLEGVRVATITVFWAGPHVTQLLAEWGADIVRVEPINVVQPGTRFAEHVAPPGQARELAEQGQIFVYYPDFDPGAEPWNRNSEFNAHSRNQRSMAADIMQPEGREAFLRLIEQSDVFIENNVPETIERANLTYEALREVNPRIIVLRMPAYGLDGPYKKLPRVGHARGGDDRPPPDPLLPGRDARPDEPGVHGGRALRRDRRLRRRRGAAPPRPHRRGAADRDAARRGVPACPR